jgi:hypothetical protein
VGRLLNSSCATLRQCRSEGGGLGDSARTCLLSGGGGLTDGGCMRGGLEGRVRFCETTGSKLQGGVSACGCILQGKEWRYPHSIKMDVATLSSFLLEELLQPTQAVSKYVTYNKQYCG